MVLERTTGKVTNLTENLDRWVNSFTWSPDSGSLFFTTDDRGRQAIQFIPVTGGAVRTVASGDSELDDMQLTRDGKTMVYTQQSGVVARRDLPRVLHRRRARRAHPSERRRSSTDRQLRRSKSSGWMRADGARVQSFVVKPYGFQPGRKYPVLMLIHGGPQGFWGHAWTYRWNAQVFAAAGYVVVMPNPRGSTGYGQKFIDEINGDWGGRAFDDIMAVADHVVANVPYADGSADGRRRRVLRRLHGRLDSRPHAALQGARLARRRLRSGERVRRHRRAVVPAVGVRRHAVGQAGGVCQMVAQQLRARSSTRRPW